jgi:hypothetical protein
MGQVAILLFKSGWALPPLIFNTLLLFSPFLFCFLSLNIPNIDSVGTLIQTCESAERQEDQSINRFWGFSNWFVTD